MKMRIFFYGVSAEIVAAWDSAADFVRRVVLVAQHDGNYGSKCALRHKSIVKGTEKHVKKLHKIR